MGHHFGITVYAELGQSRNLKTVLRLKMLSTEIIN
jgi:hypothetical protein